MAKYDNNNINNSASQLLNSINTVIDDKVKKMVRVDSAIVKRVNNNGTVDIYFPPEESVEFTNISNQTAFSLQAGDSVEVLVKNGTYSNCWVVAKHNATNNISDQIYEALSAGVSGSAG